MTVFNVTRLNPKMAQLIAKYLGVTKVEIRYSDMWYKSAPFIKIKSEGASVPPIKRKVAQRIVDSFFDKLPITELVACPRITNKDNILKGAKQC